MHKVGKSVFVSLLLIVSQTLGAIAALEKAILIDKDCTNFRSAAKHNQEIAEIYESELIDLTRAMQHWETASHLYMADDNPA
jgi:alpha-soluble NSF attachment protein